MKKRLIDRGARIHHPPPPAHTKHALSFKAALPTVACIPSQSAAAFCSGPEVNVAFETGGKANM